MVRRESVSSKEKASGLIILPFFSIVLYDEVEQRWVLLGIVSFGNRYVLVVGKIREITNPIIIKLFYIVTSLLKF